jgi:Tfp pilus assembly protein PilN
MRAVNLLPADRKRERQAPKLTPLHGAGLGILVGALALGYWGHSVKGQVDVQAVKIAELEQQQTTLTAQITKAKKTTVETTNYDVDTALVGGIASARVNWSTVMINLSRVAPKDVWLGSMAVTTPTGDTAAGANGERPAAISLSAFAKSRTEAALFISRLSGIPGFSEPRLVGGISGGNGATDAASGASTATVYSFTVEIPVDDGLFGSAKPAAAASATTSTPAPSTPENP